MNDYPNKWYAIGHAGGLICFIFVGCFLLSKCSDNQIAERERHEADLKARPFEKVDQFDGCTMYKDRRRNLWFTKCPQSTTTTEWEVCGSKSCWKNSTVIDEASQ